MKVQILGTAAGEGWPAFFCECAACRSARERGGKNIRTRSSIHIDDLLKIDFPPDSLAHANQFGLSFYELKYLLITHSHSDHLDADAFEFLIEPFCVPQHYDSLRIFANQRCIDLIRAAMRDSFSGYPGLLNRLDPFRTVALPPYEITAIRANHMPDEDVLGYIIEKDSARLLYTCDTGNYESATWEFLEGKAVDYVICECTEGPNRSEFPYHMGFPDVLDFRQKARKIGLVGSATPWVLTHFSHGGGLLHEELEALAGPEGIDVAWDGMEFEVD